jgi:hypothetical protein
MKTNISEDLPARKFAPAASAGGGSEADSGGSGDVEKKTRQLVYDSKYQVKKQMGPDTKMDPAAVVKAVLDRINKSEYPEPIKARARKIVTGDNQVKEMKEFASHNVARALYSVFVEQPSKIIDEEYIEELKRELSEADQSPEERKYKVRVTDKETGNSYIRMANRSKINELRANPNIASVEMLDLYGSPEPTESERTKGAQTASVTAGKGLAKRDYDGDGKIESGAKEYRGSVHNAIQRKKGGSPDGKDTSSVREEFIGEKDNGDENKQIKPMKGKNKCKVYNPFGSGRDSGSGREGLMAHNEIEGEVITETGYSKFLKKVHSLQEKAVSQNQQQLAGMALAYLRGEMPDASEEVKKMAEMGEKKLRDFAKTKHEGLPEKVKESKCDDSDNKEINDEEEDPRSMKTKINLVKNKLRAMGLKMSYEPEGELVDEATRSAREGVPETHRPGLEVNRRVATQNRETREGREELASKAASRRKKQTPEEQEKKREEEENFERVKGINKRGLTQRQKKESEGVRAAGRLGS